MQIIYVSLKCSLYISLSYTFFFQIALLPLTEEKIELIELMFYLSHRWHQNGNQCSDEEANIEGKNGKKITRWRIMPQRRKEKKNIDLQSN